MATMAASKSRRQLPCDHGILVHLVPLLFLLAAFPTVVLASVIPDDLVTKVLLISVDGLVALNKLPDWRNTYPNFWRLEEEGACTIDGARTDPDWSKTLPIHTSMFTGMFVSEHGMTRNSYGSPGDNPLDSKLNDKNIFHLVSSNGLKGCMFASKSKFSIFEDSWSGTTSWSSSSSKMYYYKKSEGQRIVDEWINRKDDCDFSVLHWKEPDSAGHDHGGYDNPQYRAAVAKVNGYLGQVLDEVSASGDTAIVLTADHGMEANSGSHSQTDEADNHVIPFCVWGPGVGDMGRNLYELNQLTRTVPSGNPPKSAAPPPIRAHDAGPVCADFLGLLPPASSPRLDNDLSVTFSVVGGPGPKTSPLPETATTTLSVETTTNEPTQPAMSTSPLPETTTTGTLSDETTRVAETTLVATTTAGPAPTSTHKFFMLQEMTGNSEHVCIGVEDDGVDPRVDHFDNAVIEVCNGNADHQMWSYVPDSIYDENDEATFDAGLICNKVNPELCLEVRRKRGNQAVRLNYGDNHQPAAVSGKNLAWNYVGDETRFEPIRISDIRNGDGTCEKDSNGATADKCSDLCLTYQGNSLELGDNVMTQYITKRDCVDKSPDEMWKWGSAVQLGF